MIILETDLKKKKKDHMINQGDILLAMEQNYLWSLLYLEPLTVWQSAEGGITTDFANIPLSAGKSGESGPLRLEIDNLGKSVIMESCLIL